MTTETLSAADSLPPIVLLVEDDADTRELYQTAFSLDGLWVADANGLDDALEYAIELQPDAVVTDISLHGHLEGITLAERLRMHERTVDTPIIAVTGIDPDRFHLRESLFTCVLHKPVAVESLVSSVRWAMAREIRERARRARDKASPVLEKSQTLRERSLRLVKRSTQIDQGVQQWRREPRECPRCGEPLTWSERRTVDSTVFDYYLPCPNGCGLFCFDHTLVSFMTLIG